MDALTCLLFGAWLLKVAVKRYGLKELIARFSYVLCSIVTVIFASLAVIGGAFILLVGLVVLATIVTMVVAYTSCITMQSIFHWLSLGAIKC